MTGQSRKNAVLVLATLLFAVTLAVFLPAARHDFVNLDDPDYFSANTIVQKGLTRVGVAWALQTHHAGNWHPVTWLSHMLDVELAGKGPAAPHAVNALMHALNAVLVFQLLNRLTAATWRSALVAGLFALHPLHVESVAWVAERKDVLSTFFGLLCLLAYAKYAWARSTSIGHRPQATDHGSKAEIGKAESGRGQCVRVWYAVALGFFALGLMSKPMLVT